MISSLIGMYMNRRWYAVIPAGISFGLCGMYKPLSHGTLTKKDALWFISGGMIFNGIAVMVLMGIKVVTAIDAPLYNFAILMNAIIGFATAIPTKGNDGGRVLALWRGKTEELEVFTSMNYLCDADIAAEQILAEVDRENPKDVMAGYTRNIAWMEKQLEMDNDIQVLYQEAFQDREKGNEKVARAFQLLYKHVDGKKLTSKEIARFSQLDSVYRLPFLKVHRFFQTGEDKHLQKLRKHQSHFPSQRENEVFHEALARMDTQL